MSDYAAFLESKQQLTDGSGFEPVWMPDWLFPFQRALVEWTCRSGRSALFADCGLGKTPMQLVWAENVHRLTGKPVLIVTPLAVSFQTEVEALKFAIAAAVSRDGRVAAPITITNYERLHLGRLGLGVELKPSYYRQAVKNLTALEHEADEHSWLELANDELEHAS